SDQTGEHITLPTDAGWQWAAQKDTGWAYPWGDELGRNRCNFNTGGTTPVTTYAGPDKWMHSDLIRSGDSPFGVSDMSGNAWEWCLTDPQTGDHDVNRPSEFRVLRGGSWASEVERNLRVDFRTRYFADLATTSQGFRITRSP